MSRTFAVLDFYNLPEKYHDMHDFCFYLHDLMARFLVDIEQNKLNEFEVIVKNESEIVDYKWLINNGYRKEVIYNLVSVPLLSDFLHFMYEGYITSAKGKISVSFSLLRKTFTDHLFYLEWIFCDIDNFCDSFFKDTNIMDGLSHSDIDKKRKECTKKSLKIIRKEDNLSIFNSEGWFKILYDLRYDRQSNYGLRGLFDKATHLITNFNSIKTEEHNFNFIFMGDKERHEHWDIIYNKLIILTLYSFEIVSLLFEKITEIEESSKKECRLEIVSRISEMTGFSFGV